MPNSFILVLFHEIFAGSVVQGKSTTIKSSKGAVDVLQGNGFLSSLQSARKPVSMVNEVKLQSSKNCSTHKLQASLESSTHEEQVVY
jgi:hypothetical protein